MDPMNRMYLLLIFQGFCLGFICQKWAFPSRISALIGSCVEIPCTSSVKSRTAWYLFASNSYQEIFNAKDSSSVMKEFKGRTSLVPGNNSCTLRIDPVRVEDYYKYYYPGIAGYQIRNAYTEYSQTVYLDFKEKEKIWTYGSTNATVGEATIVGCLVEHTCGSSPPSLKWNKQGRIQYKSVETTSGYWLRESKLTYIATNEDDGFIKCTATYPNGQTIESSRFLNIIYAPKYVTVTVVGRGEVMEGSDVTLQCNCDSKIKVDKYEWYKGKDKIKLEYSGLEIGVKNVNRSMEPYSCVAINAVGRGESALTEIPVSYKSSSTSGYILPATIGTICLLILLLALIVYFCWRKRCKKLASNEPGNTTNITVTGGHTGTSPDGTYTDLVTSDIGSDYTQLKPEKSTQRIITGRHLGAAHQYENTK